MRIAHTAVERKIRLSTPKWKATIFGSMRPRRLAPFRIVTCGSLKSVIRREAMTTYRKKGEMRVDLILDSVEL